MGHVGQSEARLSRSRSSTASRYGRVLGGEEGALLVAGAVGADAVVVSPAFDGATGRVVGCFAGLEEGVLPCMFASVFRRPE